MAVIILAVLIFNIAQFSRFYFVDYKRNPPLGFLPGLKEASLYLKKNKQEAERIVFDVHDDGAYIYLLFYLKYPPDRFINDVKRYSPDGAGLEWVEKFDKFLFVAHPQPDNKFKEIYVIKGESLYQKEIKEIKNQFTGSFYYKLSKNF